MKYIKPAGKGHEELKAFRFTPLFILLVLLPLLLLSTAPVRADRQLGKVVVLTVDGPIVPVVAAYLERGIGLAEQQGAVCVIELNTPGGLYQSTQKIVGRILNAGVPIVVYVSPQGGWAASAGTFVTVAAHYAAMAPGSRIGAAHPVTVGADEKVSVPTEKITEDAAAWIRSLAQMRGRNIRAAELAVRESRSLSDQEALENRLIDACARDLEELLDKINGKEVTLQDGRKVIVNTQNAERRLAAMNLREKFLLAISNPEIAYLFFTLGMLGLMVEIYNPGAVFPGVVGGLGLLLGLYGLGTLDAYWGGILLLILAFGLFVAEAFVVSHGLLGTGGLVSFVLGSMLLFTGGVPGLRVNPWLIVMNTLFFAALLALLVTAVVRGQRRRVITGLEGIIGQAAVARTPLSPEGTVFYGGSLWNAVSEEGWLEKGEKVIITGVEGLLLRVRKKDGAGPEE
jgi:membrane-bound serine protease (ClpP class)